MKKQRANAPNTFEGLSLGVNRFLEQDIAEEPKILNPWLKTNSIVMITGLPGVGKTMFAMGMVASIICNQPFGPWEWRSAPIATLYIDAELPDREVQDRLKMALDGVSAERDFGLEIITASATRKARRMDINLADPSCRNDLLRHCRDHMIGLVVLDSLSSLAYGIDENCADDWKEINLWLSDMRLNHIATLILHHPGWDDKHPRGSVAQVQNLDISIMLKRPNGYKVTDGARVAIEFTKKRIPHTDLPLVMNTEARMVMADGRLRWEFGTAREQRLNQILGLLNQGMKQAEIAECLGMDKGDVSKAVNELWRSGRCERNRPGRPKKAPNI